MEPRRGKLLLRIELFCRGNPLQRPRLGANERVYQPKENQRSLIEELWAYTPILKGQPLEGPVILDVTFIFSRGGDGKFRKEGYRGDYPTAPQFGDEDNLRKGVNDALVTTKLLTDDRFVVGGSTYKVFGPEDSVKIKIWSIQE